VNALQQQKLDLAFVQRGGGHGKVPVQWMEVGWGRFTLASTSMVQCTKPCNSGQIHPETVMETSQLDTPPGLSTGFYRCNRPYQPWDNDTCLTHFVPSIGRFVPFVIFGGYSMQLKQLALTAAIAFGACVPAHAQTEIQWWHSMSAALGDWVNDLAKQFNASQKEVQDRAHLQGHV
jgi:hypothetical protein